jgi:hypothetical protein
MRPRSIVGAGAQRRRSAGLKTPEAMAFLPIPTQRHLASSLQTVTIGMSSLQVQTLCAATPEIEKPTTHCQRSQEL